MGYKQVWDTVVDGELVRFTRRDVEEYFSHSHGMRGTRSFGPVSGDWRMIDAIAHNAAAYFGNATEGYRQ